MKSSLKVIHQTGKEDLDFVSKGYQEKGFDALVKPFFEDMAAYYQISDLVICRSGASTVAELAVCGKAAILIPYPYAAHNHQLINAKKLVERGAARMIRDEELNGESWPRPFSIFTPIRKNVQGWKRRFSGGRGRERRRRSWIIVML